MGTREVHAVCTHDCPDSCGVLVTVDELTGRALKVAGDPRHPVTRGFLCGKVARYLERVYSPERLLYPMRRRPGVPKGPLAQGREAKAFTRVSWDEALDAVATGLQQVSDMLGPEGILPYSYAGTIGQLGYASMDRRFFHRLGASQLDRTICASAGATALNQVYGTRLGTAPQDFAHAGLVLVWGANVHGNNIHLWPFLEQARRSGARLVVIDPYRTRTAALGDEWLAIQPATDGLLALALMHVLFRDKLHDPVYLEACTEGWQELQALALRPEHAPAQVAAMVGLPADTIERLAKLYGQAGREGHAPAAIRLNYGIQRCENGGTAARAIAMLPLITGSWKQRGGGLLLSTSGAFPFASAKLQMPELMQASPLGRQARTVNMNQLGHALTTLNDPPVGALFVYNCNPAAVAPDSNQVLAGLRRPDLFTVVHEQFFTDTTDYADIVLPATTFLEHKELMGAYGHYVAQISDQAIAPLGEARSNPDLFRALAHRMGFTEAAFHDGDDALIEQGLGSGHPWFEGVRSALLDGARQAPLALPRNESGNILPFSDASWFQTPSGKARLLPLPAWRMPEEFAGHADASQVNAGQVNAPEGSPPRFVPVPRSGTGPLLFLSRKADNYMNSTFANLPGHQTMERRTAGVLEMHVEDAAARGIVAGDAVAVWNPRGRIELVARVGNSVAPGVVAARLDWQKLSADGGNVNALTSQRLTDIGGGATFYSTTVAVAKFFPVAAD